MKNVILGIAFQLLAISAFAQFKISGHVTGLENNEPLQGANVFLENKIKGVATDTDGNFTLLDVPQGDHILFVSFIGYEEYSKTFQLDKDTFFEISLHEKVLLTNGVVVSATRASENSPTAFETINGDELKKENLGKDLPYLIEMTPGVVTFSDSGAGIGYTGLRVRGSDPSRVNVTINGVPLNDSESQGVFWVDLPDLASSIQSIQIQRGVGTSTNGSGAFGASVNIETGNNRDQPYALIDNSFGSFNSRKHTFEAGTGLLNEKFNFNMRLSRISSDGYIDRASSNLRSYFLSGGYNGKKSSVNATIFSGKEITYQAWDGVSESDLENNRTFNATGEISPGLYYDNQVDDYKQDHYQLHYVYKPSGLFNLGLSIHYTKGKGFFEQYRADNSFSDYGLNDVVIGSQTISSSDLVRRRWLDNDFYGTTFSAIYSPGKVRMIFGGAVSKYKGNHFGEIIWAQFASNSTNTGRYYDNDGIKNEANLYFKPEINVNDKVFIFGDIQWRNVNYSVNGTDNDQRVLDTQKSYNFINPKAGLSYRLNSRSLVYASYSVGNREPDRNDFIDAESGSIPKHERLNDFEAGYRMDSKKIDLSANFYYMNYVNQLVLTGEINDVGAPIRRNVDRSFRSGAEVTVNWKPLDRLKLSANVTYSMNRIHSFSEAAPVFDNSFNYLRDSIFNYSDTDIILSPDWVAYGKISYSPLNGLEMAFSGKYVGEQFLDNKSNDNRKLDAFFLNDLSLSYDLKFNKSFIKGIRATFLLNNIFNIKYEPNGYSYFILFDDGNSVSREDYNYYYPQAGINFMGGLSLSF